MATDEDSSLLGAVSYAIVPPSSQFSINTINGIGQVLVVAALDREVTDLYRITIVATDGGKCQLSLYRRKTSLRVKSVYVSWISIKL